GPVPHSQVAEVLAHQDVLVAPHKITPFTLSLDAIKAYEYLATDRPIVATPTSGFQALSEPGLQVIGEDGFVAAVSAIAPGERFAREPLPTWSQRAQQFAAAAWPITDP